MHILFVHKNYPAQFGHIARLLVKQHRWQCTFASELPDGLFDGVRRIQYEVGGAARSDAHYCSRTFENYIWHSHAVYEALKARPEIKPDLIVGHSGFGSTVFLRDLYDCPIINYFEWYYRVAGSDMDFRTEFPITDMNRLRARSRNSMLLLDLETCDAGYSPTNWQRSRFPNQYQNKLETIFDGVDTALWHPHHDLGSQPLRIGNYTIPVGVKLVTYVARGFESMRGFDLFMKVAKRICDRRPDVIFVCIGSDRICYGADSDHIQEESFREYVLERDDYDRQRILFPGTVPPIELARILGRSDLHLYFTVPFVLSWSLMNALACGCTVLASDTPPVREMIDHGRNGLLCGFYDVDGFTRQALEILDDPELYHPLGQAGARMIQQNYSIEQTLPQMVDLYQRVVSGILTTKTDQTLARPLVAAAESQPANSIEGGIKALARRYPWPDERPEKEPLYQKGWLHSVAPRWIRSVLEKNPSIVIELGAWHGASTRFLARWALAAKLIAVDNWPGSIAAAEHPHWKTLSSESYRQFLANCWDDRARIVPLAADPIAGLDEIANSGVRPEVIFIGRECSGEAVDAWIEQANRLFPSATLIGADWNWQRVQDSLRKIVERDLLELKIDGDAWMIWRQQPIAYQEVSS